MFSAEIASIGYRIKGFLKIYVVILPSLILDIEPLCPKELNAFIARKIMKI
jgi:hypothetical protein